MHRGNMISILKLKLLLKTNKRIFVIRSVAEDEHSPILVCVSAIMSVDNEGVRHGLR